MGTNCPLGPGLIRVVGDLPESVWHVAALSTGWVAVAYRYIWVWMIDVESGEREQMEIIGSPSLFDSGDGSFLLVSSGAESTRVELIVPPSDRTMLIEADESSIHEEWSREDRSLVVFTAEGEKLVIDLQDPTQVTVAVSDSWRPGTLDSFSRADTQEVVTLLGGPTAEVVEAGRALRVVNGERGHSGYLQGGRFRNLAALGDHRLAATSSDASLFVWDLENGGSSSKRRLADLGPRRRHAPGLAQYGGGTEGRALGPLESLCGLGTRSLLAKGASVIERMAVGDGTFESQDQLLVDSDLIGAAGLGRFFIADNETLTIHDVDAGIEVWTTCLEAAPFQVAAVDGDRLVVASSPGATFEIGEYSWDEGSGVERRFISMLEHGPGGVAAWRNLVVISDGPTLRVFDSESWGEVGRFDGKGLGLGAAAELDFSSEGLLACACGDVFFVWDLASS